MKILKTLTALTFALAISAAPVMATPLLPEDEHKQAGCCAKAAKADKKCTHKCCVEAAKKGNECEKCGGKGKIPKKEEEKK